MSKIVFFSIPAHGHTNPTLGVVRELVSRGHEVWYYSYDLMRQKIEGTGAKFVSCDAFDTELRLDSRDAARLSKDLAFSTKILVDTTLALDDTVIRHMKELKPDCIVADSMAVWGKAVALKLGIPFVSSTTTFAFNQHSAKYMKQTFGQLLGMVFSMRKIRKDIRRLQQKGYTVNNILDIIQNDQNTDTVVYTSPQFQPCAETFSDKYAFVGPSIRPAGMQFKKTREKLIYISMGTVNNDMLDLYKACVAEFAALPYQTVLSVGTQVEIGAFGSLPENVEIYPYVDQIAVLQRADVFVTHCGMNSASEGLYFGVPLVMIPQTVEQGAVAMRTEQLGAGYRAERTSAKAILAGVRTVLSEQSYREQAEKISQGFLCCSGAKGAADKILSICE